MPSWQPDIVRAIVEGRQPVGLTSSYLLHDPLPDDWEKLIASARRNAVSLQRPLSVNALSVSSKLLSDTGLHQSASNWPKFPSWFPDS